MKSLFENLDLGNWIYGLVAAVVGGGANAVVGGVAINMVDPSHFNAQHADFYKLVGGLFVANRIMSFFMYLKQNPVPQHLVSKTTITVEKVESGTPEMTYNPPKETNAKEETVQKESTERERK